jgi:hypothetical protein
VATAAPTAQNAPTARAVTNRAPTRSQKEELRAATACPAAKTASASIRANRRGIRSVAIDMAGAPMIIPAANAVISRPVRATLTCSPDDISGSRPATMYSVVPIKKITPPST